MGTTTNLGLPYPAPSDAPDGPGAIYALAATLDAASGTWAPQIGGTAATLGANPIADGTSLRFGKHVVAKGRIVFGSSASFGTGNATITSLPGTIDGAHSTGYGFFVPNSGAPIPVFFQPADGANMYIKPVQSSTSGALATLAAGFSLGTPAQSSQLLFTLDLTLV